MKVTTILASLVVGAASVGLAQAAGVSAGEANMQVASAGHDPYYPAVVSTSSKTRAQVVKELQQARANSSLTDAGHNAYYPMRFVK